jgi:hypothetical protein
MSTNELLTLLVAAYGAGLATFLAIREIQKEKKRIRIFLQFTNWAETFTLKIINVGHRPITISSVSLLMKWPKKGIGRHDIVPEGSIFNVSGGGPKFPITLEDSEQIEMLFSDVVRDILSDENGEPTITVFDNEGRHYSGYEMLVFDAKYNYYTGIPDKWKQPRRFLGIKLPVRIFGKK